MSANMRFRDEASFQAFLGQRGRKVEAPRPRKAKYNAQPTVTADGRFDSKAEAARWEELKLLERAGHITALQRQVTFKLTMLSADGPVLVDTYRADFVYFDIPNRKFVTEDRKGYRTSDYLRKKRLMLELYGIDIQES